MSYGVAGTETQPVLPLSHVTRYPSTVLAISPVGSGANFGGLTPGGVFSLDPASLAVSPRLLLSVVAFIVNDLIHLAAIILQS